MGCWNKTCGLTGLHINAGAEVYVFLLEENTNKTDRCYTTSFWNPLLLPFNSIYNDYGGGEDSSGPAFPIIMNEVAKRLIERDVGENQCHDIAVKREGFGEEEFFESTHEHRLLFADRYSQSGQLVDFTMFRKDVVDDILEHWTHEEYVGSSKGDCGYDNSYRKVTFERVLADLPEFFEKLCAATMPANNEDETEAFVLARMLMSRGFDELLDRSNKNLVAQYLRRDGYRYSKISPSTIIIDLLKAGNKADAETLLVELLKGSYLDSFMDSTRKVWLPGCHEGSQSQYYDGYEALTGAINRVVASEKAKYEDE